MVFTADQGSHRFKERDLVLVAGIDLIAEPDHLHYHDITFLKTNPAPV